MSARARSLGLALVIGLALGAVTAPFAHGAAPEFHCTAATTNCTVSGASNDNVFNFAGGPFKCSEKAGVPGVVLTATAPKTTTKLEFEASYTGCTAFGGGVPVSMNGCKYRWGLVEGGTSPYPATMDVVCPAGKEITITLDVFGCTLGIPAQTGLKGLSFTNEGSEPTGAKAAFAFSNTTFTGNGSECITELKGTHTNGKYTGTVLLKGFEDSAGVKGPQVGLHVF